MPPELLYVLIPSALAAIGWVIVRNLTGARRDEQANRVISLLEIREKLEAAGMDSSDAQRLFEAASKNDVSLLLKDIGTFTDEYAEEKGISVLDTTAAMGVQLAAHLEILDKKIEAIFVKIHILIQDEEYSQSLSAAQDSWKNYREAEALAAFQEMIGGTGRSVNSLAKSIEITEARLSYLTGFMNDLLGRYG